MSLLNDTIEEHKKLFPSFYNTDNDSNIHKHITVLAKQDTKLKEALFLIKLSTQINRPVSIQKIQQQFYTEDLIFRVTLQNIKTVLIENKTENTIIHEHTFEEPGNNYFEYTTKITDSNPVPLTKILLTVETFEGYIIQKGYPENDVMTGDNYDHDYNLDKMGALYNIPRYSHKPITLNQYDKALPPYHNKSTEDDYYYMNRILTYIKEYNNVPLPLLELWKYYGVTSRLVNRKIMIHEQNVHDMQQPNIVGETGLPIYMKTKYWYNSCAYDIYAEYSQFPTNLTLPTAKDIEDIFTNNMPITKVNQYNVNVNITQAQDFDIRDNFEIRMGDNVLVTTDPYAERDYFTIKATSIDLDTETGELTITNTTNDKDYLVVMDSNMKLWLIDSTYSDNGTLTLDTTEGELQVTKEET